ncbi:MAG: GAF domain-containing protein [Gammaproteobacteria bacterium]|nr:GAF domain-containing protein [Gammaproteobacteria bacterium]
MLLEKILPDQIYSRALQLISDEVINNLSRKSPAQTIENSLKILDDCLFLNMGRVLLVDNTGKYLRIRYAYNLPSEKRFVTYKKDEGISGFVFTTGQSMYLDDLDTNSMYKGRLINPLQLPYEKPAFSAVPIKSIEGNVIGILCVNHGYRCPEEIQSSFEVLEKTAQMFSQLLAMYSTT